VGNDAQNQGFFYNGSTYTTLSVPGAVDTDALSISGNNIVGYYENNSGEYGFLATPVPEPSVLGLLAVGAAALLIRRRVSSAMTA
jgi:hypothetical protein